MTHQVKILRRVRTQVYSQEHAQTDTSFFRRIAATSTSKSRFNMMQKSPQQSTLSLSQMDAQFQCDGGGEEIEGEGRGKGGKQVRGGDEAAGCPALLFKCT